MELLKKSNGKLGKKNDDIPIFVQNMGGRTFPIFGKMENVHILFENVTGLRFLSEILAKIGDSFSLHVLYKPGTPLLYHVNYPNDFSFFHGIIPAETVKERRK